jgi:hypothetical protein
MKASCAVGALFVAVHGSASGTKRTGRDAANVCFRGYSGQLVLAARISAFGRDIRTSLAREGLVNPGSACRS